MYPMHNVQTGKSLKYNKACTYICTCTFTYTGLDGSIYYIENVMSFFAHIKTFLLCVLWTTCTTLQPVSITAHVPSVV